MFKLRPYQQMAYDRIQDAWSEYRSVLAVLPTGGGKCLAKDTPVLMFDGSIKMAQDVEVGDDLMGPDSSPRRVLSTCTGREQMYRVTPVKGDPYVVNKSHILSLKKTGTDEVVNLTVPEYLASSRTFKHTHKGWRAAVDWPEADHDGALPAYLLGLWLGDGSSKSAAFTSMDPSTVAYLTQFAAETGQRVRYEGGSMGKAINVHITNNWVRAGSTSNALRRNGLIGDKHIPHAYKCASRAQRLELLAGIIDTDGSYDGKGFDIVQKSKRLADDIAFVAKSLGFSSYVTKCEKTCGSAGAVGTYYRQMICGDIDQVPCRLARKKAAPRKQKKDVLKTGVSVEPIGTGDYYGFEITGDRLFMLGDFTVTHNTVIFSSIIHDHGGACAAVVHRKEIVAQISLSLAALGVSHRVIAPSKTVTLIRRKHLKKFGKSFVDPSSQCGVVSVQTLTSKATANDVATQRWLKQVTLCVFDEGHHYVEQGVWARAVHLMDNAKLLFVSATPERADGVGLGAGHGGFAEVMVEGPTTKWLIDEGFLSRFVYRAPKTDIDLRNIALGKNGDFNAIALKARVVESHIVGDVVKHYRQWGENKRAIVFATDVETAEAMAAEFRAAGYTAQALSGETEQGERDHCLEQFESGAIQILVNVDLFDEGFDVPAVECVVLARPTQSLAKYLQMVGRALRIMEGKTYAVIIDPVRNWERHGAPTWPRQWTLEGKEKGGSASSDTIPQKTCDACTIPYEAFFKQCPYCGHVNEVPDRSAPDKVDGDLVELDLDAWDALFAQVQQANMSAQDYEQHLIGRNVPSIGRGQLVRKHEATKYRRKTLQNLLGWWVGCQEQLGRDKSEIYRRFFLRYGVDMATALTLDMKDTDSLIAKIEAQFTKEFN